MKKAIIACAVLCVVSLIATVGFAAAVGTQAIQEFAEKGGYGLLSRAGSGISIDVDIEDANEDGRTLQKTDSFDFAPAQLLTVQADWGGVQVRRSADEQAHIRLQQYARSAQNVKEVEITQVSDGEVKISASQPEQASNAAAVILIEIPQSVTDLQLSTQFGEIEIEHLTFTGALQAETALGNIELSDVQANTMTLYAKKGALELDKACRAAQMQLTVDFGSVELEAPVGVSYAVQYEIQTGGIETNVMASAAENNRNGAGVSGYVLSNCDAAANAQENIQVQIQAGSLELESDFD